MSLEQFDTSSPLLEINEIVELTPDSQSLFTKIVELGNVTESDDDIISSPLPPISKRNIENKPDANKKQKKQNSEIQNLLSKALSICRHQDRHGNPMTIMSPPGVKNDSEFHKQWDRTQLSIRLKVVATILSTGKILDAPEETLAHYLCERHEN